MAKREVVTKVWIEEGCIVCDACETTAPDVFDVKDETCIVKPAALDVEFTKPRTQSIIDAAEECPVDVIKFETAAVDVPEDEGAPEASAPQAPAPVAVDADAPSEATVDRPPEAAAAPVPTEAAGAKVAATAAEAASAQKGDESIQALLGAAAMRGGHAAIVRKAAATPDAVEEWKHRKLSDLPPDARQARILEAAKKVSKGPHMQRRAVIGGAALTVGWTAFGVGAGISIGPALGRFMMPNVLEEPDPRVRVGKLQRYEEMEPASVIEDYKPQGIWMIRDGDRIAALSIICTHLGCIPNWLPNDRKFKCPCHGSGYRYNGINFEGPTPRPLERFRLYVDGGIVVVDKSKKYQYELGQWDMPESYLEV